MLARELVRDSHIKRAGGKWKEHKASRGMTTILWINRHGNNIHK